MTDDQMRRFPEELGKLGFVFNFITYGGHQIDGLAGEEFAHRAPPRRHARARASAAKVPSARVAVPHPADARWWPARRRRAHVALGSHRDDEGDGQGLDAVPASRADRAAAEGARRSGSTCGASGTASTADLNVSLRPHSAGSQLLELGAPVGRPRRPRTSIFEPIHDRQGRSILSIRDQNTFDAQLRRKRLMTARRSSS